MTRAPSGPRGAASAARRIDEALFLDINGVPQWVTLRGDDSDNPLLMMIGGPGVPLGAMSGLYASWEAHFTLLQWDQPGSGSTWARNGDEALTYGRLVRDAAAVIAAVHARFGARKAILFCVSGGTVIGLPLARARPDLVSVYVGNGQVVNWALQETESYRLILAAARARGDAAAVAEIEGIGPPPWDDIASAEVKGRYANLPTAREAAALANLPARMATPLPGAPNAAPGYPPVDHRARSLAAFTALSGELGAYDARATGVTFQVPMVFLQGAEDAHTTTAEVVAFAGEITAPHTRLILLEGAGHMSSFLTDELLAHLLAEVRPLAISRL